LKCLSLLTLLLMTVHMTQDVLGQREGAVLYPIPVLVFTLWLYATLFGADRAWAYVVMFLGGLIGAGMIVVHSRDFVVGKSGGFFFVWTLFALATTGWVTVVLSAREFWIAIRTRRSARSAVTSAPAA
jgi:hypothetical protein